MRKVYFLGALSGLLLASCANDDLVVKPVVNPGETADDAISFNLRLGNQSRATALETVINNFGVWSIKANDNKDFGALALNLNNPANMSANVVINDYKVYYDDATHYGSQWTYLTSDEPDSIPELQFLKYWDGSVEYNYFFGYAPHNTKHNDAPVTFINKDETTGHAELNFTKIKTTSDPNYKFLYSDATVAKVSEYIYPENGSTKDPKKVPLNFHYLLGQVRLAFWESIQGYSVELENVEFSSPSTPSSSYAGKTFGVAGIPAEYNPSTDPNWTLGKYAEEGTAKVEYGYPENVGETKVTVSKVSFPGVTLSDASTYLDFAIPTGEISTTRPEATLSPTTYNVVPNAEVNDVENCGFQFVLNYTLKAEDTNEVIHVKGARVFVPADYTQWKKNTVYTYVFQITKDSSGTTTGDNPDPNPKDPEDALYPIIFDELVVKDLDTDSEKHDFVINQKLKDLYINITDKTPPYPTTTLQLQYVDDDVTYTWKSSDTEVAEVVENGSGTGTNTSLETTVTPKKAGITKISVEDPSGKEVASCNVYIYSVGTLSDPDAIAVGGKTTLNSPFSATIPVSWASKDTSVATIAADGTVTGVAPGVATLTCTITGTTESKSCNITVYKIDDDLTDASASVRKDGTITLDSPIQPSSLGNWSTSDASVATVADGTVSGLNAGTATITCSFDITGSTQTKIWTVTVTAAP